LKLIKFHYPLLQVFVPVYTFRRSPPSRGGQWESGEDNGDAGRTIKSKEDKIKAKMIKLEQR
jgi:hypothetical protein